MDEVQEIIARYNRRKDEALIDRYSILNPSVYMNEFEKQRVIIKLFKKVGITQLTKKTLLEVGCGTGTNLLYFLRLGFSPHLIVGNELIPERAKIADEITPSSLKIYTGNAVEIDFGVNTFDIVYQSMVFSSILDDEFAKALAKKMWSLLRVGGGILWYDFIYNNPSNKDVRGISFKTVKDLFPEAKIIKYKISLAPPLARIVTIINDKLYTVFNSLSILRTHLLCWIAKN